jgi:hypothetical protein
MIEQWKWVAKSQIFRRPGGAPVLSSARAEIFRSLSCRKVKTSPSKASSFGARGGGPLNREPLES